MRKTIFNGISKTPPTGGGTTTFTSSEIDGGGMTALHVILGDGTGAGNLAAGKFTRFRAKANGATIWDCSIAQLQALLERYSPANFAFGSSAKRFTIPFNDFRMPLNADSDRLQFPPGALPQFELDNSSYTAGTNPGTITLAWSKNDEIEPEGFSKFISQQTNIPSGVNNLIRVPISELGDVRGLTIPDDAHVSRLRIVLNGDEVFNAPGTGFGSGTGSALLEVGQLEDGTTITDPIFLELESGSPALSGNSWAELVTIAGFAASTEIAIYSVEHLKAMGG